MPVSFLPDVFLSACFDKARLVRWVKFWFLVLLTKIHMSGAFPRLPRMATRHWTAVQLPFWHVCCQAFAPASLWLSVADGMLRTCHFFSKIYHNLDNNSGTWAVGTPCARPSSISSFTTSRSVPRLSQVSFFAVQWFMLSIRCWSVRACAVRTLHLIGPPAVPVLTSRLEDSHGRDIVS